MWCPSFNSIVCFHKPVHMWFLSIIWLYSTLLPGVKVIPSSDVISLNNARSWYSPRLNETYVWNSEMLFVFEKCNWQEHSFVTTLGSSSSTGLFNRVLTQHNAEGKTDCQKTFWNGHAPGESLHTHRDLKEQEKKINKCWKNISDILLLQVTISFVETKLQSSPNSEKQQTSDSPW